jgi:HTH-type transcriptional regulator / antitoxin HigA
MIKIIKYKKEHEKAMDRIAELVSADPAPGTAMGDELELLAHLVEDFEKKNHDIGLPSPLEAIQFRMEQQNLRAKDLVPYLGSASRVSEVLRGKRQLSVQMIRELNKGLGIPAEVLLQKQSKVHENDRAEAIRQTLVQFPANVFEEIFRRKWFDKFCGTLNDAREKSEELLGDFLCFGSHSKAIPAFSRQSLRGKSTDNADALLAWKTRVLRLASKKRLKAKFDPSEITKDFTHDLAALSRLKGGPRLAAEELESYGIAVVIERHLPTTHLDGAAMTLPNDTPVIGLTLRYDRLDNFFFCLFHELGHVVHHIVKGKADLFMDDLKQVPTDKFEKEADDFALECLISEKDWRRFWQAGEFDVESVRREAKRLRIHGAILAGRVQKEKNDYQALSRIVNEPKVRHLFEGQAE